MSERNRHRRARNAGPKTAANVGGIWLYGKHPVLAAIANPKRHCRRLVIADGPATARAVSATIEAGDPGKPEPESLPAGELARFLPAGAVHQGMAALVDPLPEKGIEDICLEAGSNARACVVVLDQVSDPQNVGAVLRAAAAFGAVALVVQDRHAPPASGALAKAASGAFETVPLVRVVNLARAIDTLKGAGFWCVGLDSDAGTSIHQAGLSGRTALVLGAEDRGLRRLTAESCDGLVRIELAPAAVRGSLDSLNVAGAAAVALYELTRNS